MKFVLASSPLIPTRADVDHDRRVASGKVLIAGIAVVSCAAMAATLLAMAVSDHLSTRAVDLLSARQFYQLARNDAKYEMLETNLRMRERMQLAEREEEVGSRNVFAFPPQGFASKYAISASVKQAARLCGTRACGLNGCDNSVFFSCMAMPSNEERYKLLQIPTGSILLFSPQQFEAMSMLAKEEHKHHEHHKHGEHHQHHEHHKHKDSKHKSGLSADNLLVGELGSLPNEPNMMEGELANLPIDKNLINGELANLPAEANLMEGELANLPVDATLIDGELANLPAEPNLMQGELANLPSEPNLIIGELGGLPAEKNLLVGELGDLPAEKNLMVGELGGLPAEKNLIEGELGNLPAEKNLIVGELGDLPAEKNLMEGELGTLPVSTVWKDCGAGACDPEKGCDSKGFFACMMYQMR